ncbi:MAG: ribonuclease III [Saezia sp.]
MKSLEKNIGYLFKNRSLLKDALTHRSYSASHYERLEFLGDSVLNLCISHQLFTFLSDAKEGDLSRIRAHLVREATLYQLAVNVDLNKYLLLGEGELRSGGQERPSILADALEALIGAVYLDAGFEEAKALVERLFHDEFERISKVGGDWGKDPKTALQEWLQNCHLQLPQYTLSVAHGALHEQVFEIECLIPQLHISALGQGHTKRLAEQAAAEQVLVLLKTQYGEAPKHIKIKGKQKG